MFIICHMKIKKPYVHFINKKKQKKIMIKWTQGFFIFMWWILGYLYDYLLAFT